MRKIVFSGVIFILVMKLALPYKVTKLIPKMGAIEKFPKPAAINKKLKDKKIIHDGQFVEKVTQMVHKVSRLSLRQRIC